MSPARRPPSVDAILRSAALAGALARHGRQTTADAIRAAVAEIRAGTLRPGDAAPRALAILDASARPSLRPVLNLTGVVLHTNLGRALLAESAITAATDIMRAPANLEYDLETGARGERDDHLRPLLRQLTGAEDALAVNNNAAAVVLVLAALAGGRESIVSRGELIEIGGSFRLPDIMRAAGTRLVEVGTTNRTHARDFEAAIGPDTALVLKVHPSNYRIEGFSHAVPVRELASIAHCHALPLVEDLGSGTLTDLARLGLPHERTVTEALRDGADLVTFSADKLLGGPQAGFILGRADLIRTIARHPLRRALRLDKIRIAALEATLRLYRDPDRLAAALPTLRVLTRPLADIRAMAERLAPVLAAWAGPGWRVGVIECRSQIGSGALPVETLASAGLALAPVSGSGLDAMATRLRALPTPVIGAIRDGAIRLDLRALEDEARLARLL
jgi:L-seryl-tRNA(Ser) seleniumtransferase